MPRLSSQHHSFDIELAKEYGPIGAILIHHFLHWIRFNRRMGKNIKEGKCWTYQTKKEVQNHFPYLTYDTVRYQLDLLVDRGVLEKRNFNRSPMDRTIWYCFADEPAWGVDEANLNNVYDGGYPPSIADNPHPSADNPRAIPDTIKEDTKEHIRHQVSAEAEQMADIFLTKIREKKKDFATKGLAKSGLAKWPKQFDDMLRIDEIEPDRIKRVIDYVTSDVNQLAYVLCPTKLRKQFYALEMKIQGFSERKLANENRQFAIQLKEKYPEQMKDMSFDSKYVKNTSTAKELPFSLPAETFRDALLSMFGGAYAR